MQQKHLFINVILSLEPCGPQRSSGHVTRKFIWEIYAAKSLLYDCLFHAMQVQQNSLDKKIFFKVFFFVLDV